MTEKVKQALQEAAFAFAAFFATGFTALNWGVTGVPDYNAAKAALAALAIGALGAAGKAFLWYLTGTVAPPR